MNRFLKIILWGLSVLILCILVSNLYIHAKTKSYIYQSVSSAPVADTALVLGAAVLDDGSLSEIFTDRADMAIALYKAGKVATILVSGDNSTVEYNEVNPVRLYLIDNGVADEDIFLDYAGFDTYSSMYRARDIFSVSSILVITQSFHLPRSIFIARNLGIDAYGVNADVGHILLRNYIREIFANEKALFNLLLHTQPKFLGEKIPITDVPDTVSTTTERIVVDFPQANQVIQNPLTVSGTARGYWFFEASFPIDVVDWDGKIIGSGHATADTNWMTEDFVHFTGTVNYDVPADIPYRRGAVIFRKDNPSGLPEHDDAVEIPVEFGETKKEGTGEGILPFDSGVYGTVLRGPICPVMQNPPQPGCDDQPFETTVQVSTRSSGEETLFADMKTNANGEFSFQLPPGDYTLNVLHDGPFPNCTSQEISIKPKVMQEVTISCDTGIR